MIEEPWPETAEEMTGVTNYHLLDCAREIFHIRSLCKSQVLSCEGKMQNVFFCLKKKQKVFWSDFMWDKWPQIKIYKKNVASM